MLDHGLPGRLQRSHQRSRMLDELETGIFTTGGSLLSQRCNGLRECGNGLQVAGRQSDWHLDCRTLCFDGLGDFHGLRNAIGDTDTVCVVCTIRAVGLSRHDEHVVRKAQEVIYNSEKLDRMGV